MRTTALEFLEVENGLVLLPLYPISIPQQQHYFGWNILVIKWSRTESDKASLLHMFLIIFNIFSHLLGT